MAIIEWDDSFNINNNVIDSQHKRWFEIHNKMHQLLIHPDPMVSITSLDVLLEVLDYTKFHFNSEEEYMRDINYPDFTSHRRIHRDFENLIFGYHREIIDGKRVLNTEIIGVIKNWLIEHIQAEDQKITLFEKSSLPN